MTYRLHLRTACGAERVTEHHQLPRVFVVPLEYRHRLRGDFLSTTPFMHVPTIESREFELDEYIRDFDGDVVGGKYVEREGVWR